MDHMKTNYTRLIALILSLVIALGIFAGCDTEKNIPQEGAVTFTDALGRTVTLSQEPERVAALIGSFADVWVLSGGTVCAAVEDAWDDFGLDLPEAVNIGGAHSPNLELLLSANPDFVLASASTASNVDMKDTLEAAGITVAYFDVDNFGDYLEMLNICTDITGRPPRTGVTFTTSFATDLASRQGSPKGCLTWRFLSRLRPR